jgi:Xaa-Pro aminopeptidase|tara:strand:- start:9147 stop:10937 length:1791 start_codon:yes stop_codon:yes gene_type:complete
MNNQHSKRLKAVRAEMGRLNIDAFIVPHEDEYLLEEVPEHNNRLKWLNGFTGTVGVAVVLKETAIMFVDGRYKVQVSEQVDEQLYYFQNLSEFEKHDWLGKALSTKSRIGLDPKLHTFAWYNEFVQACTLHQVTCVDIAKNIIDQCWKDRPHKKSQPVEILADKYHGKPSKIKRTQTGEALKASNVDCAIITSLDSISWLLNLRGRDVPCLPVFFSTAIINKNGDVICFLALENITENITSSFDCGVSFKAEQERDKYFLSLTNQVIQVDPQKVNADTMNVLRNNSNTIVESLDPISLLKAQKNVIELSGFKACHLRDASAVVNFLAWLDDNINSKVFYDEAVLSNKLESYRMKDALYQQPSFDTVSASGSNAAMCHYNHKDSMPKLMTNNSIYLVDSGAHYLDGSTDVTRTVAIGKVSSEQKRMATLVLKGHISLAQMKFPYGTTGQHLDAFARQYLWQHGYDYAHGTGHGVGHYLNVHEGPQRIAKFNSEVTLLSGMVVSIEPGYYRESEFGIRHENLYFIKESEALVGAEIPMLAFEVLTHVPFDKSLIDHNLLSQSEIDWLNNYHQQVYRHISPLIHDTSSINWLRSATMAI